MALAGNIVWWLTLNVVLSVIWFVIGVIMFVLVITIPFGRASFTMAKLCLAPFGKDVVSTAEVRAVRAVMDDEEHPEDTNLLLRSLGGVASIIWFPIGLVLAIIHALIGVFFFVPILTIPLGVQHFKIAGLSLLPIGKRVVSIEMAKKIRDAKAERDLKSKRNFSDKATLVAVRD